MNQGKDATEEFEPIHPPDTLDKYLDKSKHLGDVDMNTVEKEVKEETPEERQRQELIKQMPLLEQCYNLMDFEAVARRIMKKSAWAYYSSAADDEIVRSLPHLPSTTPRADALTGQSPRRFARITRPSTGYGSGLRCSWTWRR